MTRFSVTNFDPISERRRLVALCRRWIDDPSAAEDIVQETILIGLRRQQRNAPPESWQPFLTGVARRLCGNFQRRQAREAAHRETKNPTWDAVILPDGVPGTPSDPMEALLQAEREALLDRALSHLKAPMRDLLVARYVEEQPLSEMAARQKITENVAAARMHRSREALLRVLTTVLHEEAAGFGLLPGDAADGWRETPIFCPRCGTSRLEGRFVTNTSPEFALRCLTCSGQLVGMTNQVAAFPATTLAGVSGFRAGLNRVNRWWQAFLARALQQDTVDCVRCGRSATARITDSGIALYCDFCCEQTFFITPTGLLYHSEAMQQFWRRYPKLRNRGERPVICEGRPAIITTFADLTDNARIEAVYDQATLQPMRIESTG